MKTQTVRKRIFMTNLMTILVTLIFFLLINLILLKVYWEGIERKWEASVTAMAGTVPITALLEDWTIHQNGFYVLLIWDGILCVAVLCLVNLMFTRRLIHHIMVPLETLEQGAKRIKEGDLTTAVSYSGDQEFEIVCDAFQQMQEHILWEQEKNRRYEKARTDMIAGISHDLRTPLTAIRGSLKGVLDGIAATPELQNRFLRVAYERTGDMEKLLGQMFELSKLETGNLPMNLQSVSLADFVENYVRKKQIDLREGEETLVAHVPVEVKDVQVLLDQEQLSRIFDNLFDNSRKYAGCSPLSMELRVECLDHEVELVFSDDGQGVSEEKLPHLFEEFYRGDESRNGKKGNGLGLYIVKYLTEAMHGSVWAESKEGFSVHMKFQKYEE